MRVLGALLVVAAIATPAQTNDISIDNFKFAAPTITVPVGAAVTWTNRDDVPHNVVSTDGAFKSPVLDTGQKFSHTFETPGTFKYYCSLHPRMTTAEVVQAYRDAYLTFYSARNTLRSLLHQISPALDSELLGKDAQSIV